LLNGFPPKKSDYRQITQAPKRFDFHFI